MRPIGLYIHIPFCDGKCYYCDFFSKKLSQKAMDEYTEKLISLIGAYSDRLDRNISTVYFGGGTPSLLGHERLVSILDAVYSRFKVSKNAEVTLEVNPSSTPELDFSALRSAGFNRLSIGLQSAHDNELSALGRRHTRADAERTVADARKAGLDNISLDVMLAIPYQTFDTLKSTLEFCAELNARHISAYILKIEEGTRFYREREKLKLFTDDEQADFYAFAVDTLTSLGYGQYEISNFSKPGFESRHNLLYWHDEEYLGLGPSAHSFIDGRRFYYPRSFDDFYADDTVYEGPGGDKAEYIMLALRLSEGLIFERYKERFGEDPGEEFIRTASNLSAAGFISLDSSSLSLTPKGFIVSNSVITYLLNSL